MAEKRTGEPQTHVAKQSRKSLTLEMKMNVIRRIENGDQKKLVRNVTPYFSVNSTSFNAVSVNAQFSGTQYER